MENLSFVSSLGASNKRKLLKAFNHKTINDAVKHYTDIKKRKYTEAEKLHAFKLMQDDYNDIVRNFRQEAKETRTKIKSEFKVLPQGDNLPYPVNSRGHYVDDNEYRKQNINYEKALGNIDVGHSRIRLKPTVDITNKFKKSSKQILIRNPNITPDVSNGYESLKMINNAIPELRNAMNEYKGMKIHVVFHLSLLHNKEGEDGTHQVNDLPSSIPVQTITNMSEVNTTIQEMLTTMRNRIPEVETEKSGWKYQYTSRIVINVMKYEPLRGGSYLPLPAELNNKKCCINIKN